MNPRERLCWIHPGDEELWTTDYVGVRTEPEGVVPACRKCAAELADPSRIRNASEITVGLSW